MHALTIRPIDRAALSALCIPKMKTGDLRTNGEYHLAIDDSPKLARELFWLRLERRGWQCLQALCVL
jgi:hypothetical protein